MVAPLLSVVSIVIVDVVVGGGVLLELELSTDNLSTIYIEIAAASLNTDPPLARVDP